MLYVFISPHLKQRHILGIYLHLHNQLYIMFKIPLKCTITLHMTWPWSLWCSYLYHDMIILTGIATSQFEYQLVTHIAFSREEGRDFFSCNLYLKVAGSPAVTGTTCWITSGSLSPPKLFVLGSGRKETHNSISLSWWLICWTTIWQLTPDPACIAI